MAWERALEWLPTFTCTIGDVVVRGTIFAPYGRDADLAGAVYAIALESRGAATIDVRVAPRGHARSSAAARPHRAPDRRRSRSCRAAPTGVSCSKGSAQPGLVALAAERRRRGARSTHEWTRSYSLARTLTLPAGGHARRRVLPRRGSRARWRRSDGRRPAAARVACAARGARATRCSSSSRAPGTKAVDRLINRNLLFAYFYGVGRALDDAHYYLVRTRAPWHGRGVTIRDWEALMWTLPAVQLADARARARAAAAHVRAARLRARARRPLPRRHAVRAGLRARGGRRRTRSPSTATSATPATISIVDEPVIADALYLAHDDLQRPARTPHSALLDRGDAGRHAGRAPVHAARQRGGRAGARDPAPYARRGDVARPWRIPQPCARRSSGTSLPSATGRRTLRVGDRSRRQSGRWTTSRAPAPSGCRCTRRSIGTTRLYRRTVKALPRERSVLVREMRASARPRGDQVLPLAASRAAARRRRGGARGRRRRRDGEWRAMRALSGLLAWTAWYAVHALGVTG